MALLTLEEMLAMRAAGKGAREIGEAAGLSHTAVLRRFRRADKAAAGPKTAEVLKQELIESLDPKKLTARQKVDALRSLTKSRKRGRCGDLASEFERYWERTKNFKVTPTSPPASKEEARRFFTEVMTGAWTPLDLSRYRNPAPEEAPDAP